tara:strand:+ start:958 stop:1200 length:243 start_codon:yes stop_codon:yes gene_type:complete
MKWYSILILLPLLILFLYSIEGYEDYTLLCLKDYKKNMKDILKNDIFRQYTGYTDKPYLDRIRYLDVEGEPFPTDPDFFL